MRHVADVLTQKYGLIFQVLILSIQTVFVKEIKVPLKFGGKKNELNFGHSQNEFEITIGTETWCP